MKNLKQIFHILSYLQYPLLVFVIYFAAEPYFNFYFGEAGKLSLSLDSLNNMLIFLGIAISFSSLQDTRKTSLKFEKKIWKKPKTGKWFIFIIMLLSIIVLSFGVFGFLISENEQIKEVSIGSIVLGIGLLGFLKVGIETFEHHRVDKNNTEEKSASIN
jgi:magnesium-transporting ATPase (P-type)